MKKRCILFLLVVIIVQTTACTNHTEKIINNTSEKSDTLDNKNANENSKTNIKVLNNKTVGTGESYNIDGMEVMEVTSDCADRLYTPSLDNMIKYSTEVIRGITRNVSFDAIEGMAWTKIDIEITESLYGDLKEGDLISIYLLGGYIPLSEHIKYFNDEFRFSDLTKEQINNTMIHSIIENEEHPLLNEENVYFLMKTPEYSPLPDGAYERLCGKYSEFSISENGETLSREKEVDNSSKVKTEKNIEEFKKQDIEKQLKSKD